MATFFKIPFVLESFFETRLDAQTLFVSLCNWNDVEMSMRMPFFVQVNCCIVDIQVRVSFLELLYILG